VQILVLVARSLTETTTEDDRSGERFRVAVRYDTSESVLSLIAETALKRLQFPCFPMQYLGDFPVRDFHFLF